MARTVVALMCAAVAALLITAGGIAVSIYVSEWIGSPLAVFLIVWLVPSVWRAARGDRSEVT